MELSVKYKTFRKWCIIKTLGARIKERGPKNDTKIITGKRK